MNIKDITSCPDCGSMNIIHGTLREQIICRDCGLIFEPLAPGLEEKMPLTKPAVSRAAAKPKVKKAKKAKKPKKKAVKKKAKKKAKKPKKKAAKKKAKPKKKLEIRKISKFTKPKKVSRKAKKKKPKKKASGITRFLKGLRKKRR